MKNDFENLHFQEISSYILLKVVLVVLRTHYLREADKIKEILNEFDHLNLQNLCEMWDGLKEQSPSQEKALEYLTQWITSSIDGGNLTLSSRQKS